MIESEFDPEFQARLRKVRREIYGDPEIGVSRLAKALGIAVRTWEHYESGVPMPDPILLQFVCLTCCDPGWLLTGEGDPYIQHAGPRPASPRARRP